MKIGNFCANNYSLSKNQKQNFGASIKFDKKAQEVLARELKELGDKTFLGITTQKSHPLQHVMKKIKKIHPEQTLKVIYVPQTGGYAPFWGPVSNPDGIKIVNLTTGKHSPKHILSFENNLSTLLNKVAKEQGFWKK